MKELIKSIVILMVICFSISLIQSCKHKTNKVNSEFKKDTVVTSKKLQPKPENLKTSINTKVSNDTLVKNKIENLNLKSPLKFGGNIKLGKVYTDTVKFVEFNDNGDYNLLFIEKQENILGLICTRELPRFITGDELEIQWKMDSIRHVGDSDYIDYVHILDSVSVTNPLKIENKKVKFLWLETNDGIDKITLNKSYIKDISEPEKAALAYIATFIGNECEWDGKATDNLKCKILWDLKLRYQCSFEHLDFLKFWFRNNNEVLEKLKRCPKKPEGATISTGFETINIEVINNTIIVFFKAFGYNIRLGEHWNWTEKHIFKFTKNELIMVNKEISEKTFK